MFGVFVHYSTSPIYDVSMNLFCWPSSVDIFNILPGFLWQPLLTRSVASLKLKLRSGYKAVDCCRPNKNAEWRSGKSTVALASHQCGPVRILASTPYTMWVEFVVGSRPCPERFFSVYFGFPSTHAQYVGSTTTKFRLRFNNHKVRFRAHSGLSFEGRNKDDLLYRHFFGPGHHGLEDVSIQLIDRGSGEESALRDKEGQWAYRLNCIQPQGLNISDFFYSQNRSTRSRVR